MRMAKGSHADGVTSGETDLENQLDLMTLGFFENIDDDVQDDHLDGQLFIESCYGRGKALHEVVPPRLPKKYQFEMQDFQAKVPLPFNSHCSIEAQVRKPRPCVGRGRARLLQEQMDANEPDIGLPSRPGLHQSSTQPPFSGDMTKTQCILMDQDFDVSHIGRNRASGLAKYDVKSQEEFPRLSAPARSSHGKNQGRARRRQVYSLETIGQQIIMPEVQSSESERDVMFDDVGSDGDTPSTDSSCAKQDLVSTEHAMSIDDRDNARIFNDVSVEVSDGTFEAVRTDGRTVSQKETHAEVTDCEILQHDSSILDIGEINNIDCVSINNGTAEQELDQKCQDGTFSYLNYDAHQMAACNSSDSGVENSQNDTDLIQDNTGAPSAASESEASNKNGPSNVSENDSCGPLNSSGKAKSRKVWTLQGSDVIQVDRVPKGGEKELEDFIAHYGRIVDKEKMRSGGKWSLRFRILDDGDNMDWIAECFHQNDAIFSGTVLECHRLLDKNADGTEV